MNEIVLGKRDITADTALRLGNALGVDPRRWMLLQVDYDLYQAALPPESRRRRSETRGTEISEWMTVPAPSMSRGVMGHHP